MNAIPYLIYEDAPAAIEFLKRAFGFLELDRTTAADGVVLNCELVGSAGNQSFGDRRYSAKDPQGHRWFFAHPISDDSPARRA